jgi:anti-sigma factor (TIGR02949 family)
MSCNDFRKYITGYVDHELSVDLAVALEEHVEKCSPCQHRLQAERWVADAVQRYYVRQPVPERLQASLAMMLSRAAGDTMRRRWLAAVAGGLAAAVVLLAVAWNRSPQGRALPPQALLAAQLYEQAVAEQFVLELRTAEANEADRWLATQLAYYPTGSLRPPIGMRLEGATTVRGAGLQRLGVLLYRAEGKPVLLLVAPAETHGPTEGNRRVGNTQFRTYQSRGRKLVAWSHGSLSYVLVSQGPQDGARACASCHAGVESDRLRDFPAASVL